MSFVEESLGILHDGEDAQLKQHQRQSSELCDQMALCMDMHMQSVYAAMCQHFHPAEVVEEKPAPRKAKPAAWQKMAKAEKAADEPLVMIETQK